jgi:fructokinase
MGNHHQGEAQMHVVCMGELLIDFVALESGVTVGEASGFQKAPGGAPANVAVAAARLGLQSGFLGQVGDDPFGHHLSDVLSRQGVDVSGLRFSSQARTMLAFVALGAGGERTFMFYRHPSADMMMTPADIATDVIDRAQVFHFGSITMISSPAKEATLAAAEHARRAGKLISYDPNLRLALWGSVEAARAGMRLGLPFANVVKISDEEIDAVLEPGEQVSDLWAKFPALQVVLLTHGADGSTALTRAGQVVRQSGFKVDSVDTTGAGDSFVAATLTRILEAGQAADLNALDYREILRFANATAAITTTKRGAIPALPDRAQVDAFLAQQSVG